MQYQTSHDAAEQIERLFLFGIERFGAAQATKYLDGLETHFKHIANSLVIYPDVAHIRAGYRRSVYGIHTIHYFREIGSHSLEISVGGLEPPRYR